MTYHMSRVAHWIQNKNINPYPTNIPRQINYTPWAEYAILHLQILSGSDRFANLIQWISMLGRIIAVSLLTSFFKANKQIQLFSAFLASTIPMGILQGSSTQNDYVITFWLLSFLCFFYQYINSGRNRYAIFSGISLGLCLLTKGTGYLYAMPFLVLLSFPFFKKDNRSRLKLLPVIIGIALILNASYYARNYSLTKTLVPPSESSIINQSTKPVFFVSNLLQNAALHLGMPFPSWNRSVEKVVSSANKFLKVKSEDNNSFHFPDHPFHEDHAGNFLHTLLIFSSLFVFLFSKRKRSNKTLLFYLIVLITTSLIFNFTIRWNLFQSRYHLPLFPLWCPLIAVSLQGKKNYNLQIISIILFLCALPWIFMNQSRPLIGEKNIFQVKRIDQYFNNRPYLSDPYKKTVEYLKEENLTKLGLSCGPDDWEYPFWVLLNINHSPLTLQHVLINNFSKKLEASRDYIPDVIINMNSKSENHLNYKGSDFIRTRKFHPINLYLIKTANNAEENAKHHFKNMLALNYLASSLPINEENMTKLILLRKEEFNEAQLVDIEELKKTSPLLANHFEKDLIPGLTYRLMGYAQKDRKLRAYGTALIAQWNQWLNKNKSTINLLLK